MEAIQLKEKDLRDIEAMQKETITLIKQLCAIPAPSHHEERRAAFIRDWFETRGMRAQIDEAKNVLVPMGLEEHEEIVIVMAHTDTVFPDLEPMPLREQEGKLFCPGVGDDTANVAALMQMANWLKTCKPRCGVLFVANSCEEGLGNLKGCRNIMKVYASRVRAVVSLDGTWDEVCARAVGSLRYRITARTRGGHSFSDFGSRNAIEVLAQLINELYAQDVPKKAGSRTTYNVGTISGGTSVNTIAQQAEMLYEYRSDDAECLHEMEAQLRGILARNQLSDASVEVECIGERPCARLVDPRAQSLLETAVCQAIERYVTDECPPIRAGSTDCNIPLSLGIPSVCFGVYEGEGAHTREEWIRPASLEKGMRAAASVLLNWFEPQGE